MKTATNHRFVFVIALLCLLLGCSEEAAKDQLFISKDKVCLSYQGKEQCITPTGSYRLYLKDGKPVLEELDQTQKLVQASYPQFGRPDAIKTEKLGVIIENKVLSLRDGDRVVKDTTGLGFIMVRDGAGTMTCAAGACITLAPKRLQLAPSDSASGSEMRRMSFSADTRSSYMEVTSMSFASDDAAQRFIPNDTGTEVVIIDNFKVVGNCNAETPADCCPSGAPVGPDIPVTEEMVGDYLADGQKLLACFPTNSICTFTDGDKLIVLVCARLERYCIDYSICDITITTTDAGICFSVPATCDIDNPFD